MIQRHARPILDTPESGYLLIAVTAVLLAISGLVASFSFSQQRDIRQDSIRAIGEQLGHLAIAAHHVAQERLYQNQSTISILDQIQASIQSQENLLVTEGALNSFQAIANPRINAVTYQTDIILTAQPFSELIPSAFLILQPQDPDQVTASDTVALLEGLAKAKVTKVAIGGATPVGDTCENASDGMVAPTAIRWGTEINDCISTTDFSGPLPPLGSLIIPTWEAALANLDTRAVMRYPQPGRPELNTMTAPLTLAGNTLGTVNTMVVSTTLTTDDLTVTNPTTIQGTAVAQQISTATWSNNGGDITLSSPMGVDLSASSITVPTITVTTCQGEGCTP